MLDGLKKHIEKVRMKKSKDKKEYEGIYSIEGYELDEDILRQIPRDEWDTCFIQTTKLKYKKVWICEYCESEDGYCDTPEEAQKCYDNHALMGDD